jgi:hypothetical protein
VWLCEDGAVDFDLTRLGDREFEHLSQALALQVLGPGVSVFGDGPDGGREATFEGRMRFPEPGEPWDGYGVVQAKFKRRLVGGSADTDAFLRAVTLELDRWANVDSNRVKKGRLPQYVLFTTNVVLSAVPGSGGVDRAEALIASYADRLGLKGWRVWHHDQLCRLLDLHPAIRRTYAALITPSDVLARWEELLGGTPATLGQRLAVHATKELTAQQWVRLGEAGHPTNEKLRLGEVAIDLPATLDPIRPREMSLLSQPTIELGAGEAISSLDGRTRQVRGVVAYLIGRGDTVLRPSSKPATNPRLVVVGGPGQGKSTMGQLLCQVYRVALLVDRPEESMGPDAAQVLGSTRSQLARLRIPMPACRRWPLQVSLSAYGDAIAGHPDVSLLRFLAEQVSRRTPERVTASDLVSWLQAWPWLLVLDGLDEVAAPTVRETLLQQVSDFLTDAAAADADLMIVATTRPQGYAWEFSPAYYDHLQLRPLERREALGYARRLAAVRHAGDPDLEAQVVTRVANAAEDPITARLLRSPLQVTIMSILLERRVRVPQDRHGLFDAYYQTIYDREAAKPGPVGLLLDQQRSNVNLLHEQVGLLLQIRAERGGDAEALLPRQDLHDLARQRLYEEGHPDAGAERLAAQLVTAATRRLVLLVPLTADAVGFEVRSLQEFMAARALLRGDSTVVLERLRRLAPSAHWRNTWLLAAGRAFTHHEHLRDPIVTLLEDVDTDSLLAMLVAPGAQLAMDILDDDIAAQAPRYRLLFAKRALELLDHPPEVATSRLGHTLREVCEAHPPTRLMVDNAIDRALATKGPLSVAALMVLAQWEAGTGGLAASARQRLHRFVHGLDQHQRQVLAGLGELYPHSPLQALAAVDPLPKPRSRRLGERVRQHVRTAGLAEDSKRQVELLLKRLRRVRIWPQEPGSGLIDVTYDDGPAPDQGDELADPTVQDVIVTAAGELVLQDWQTAGVLRGVLSDWVAHRPAGEHLSTSLEPDDAGPESMPTPYVEGAGVTAARS